ncbi:MAG TPA: SAM-dependent methyltransferase [Hyphomicrobiales bacterium]|nr:SAM-dependent methyltransferase [Hyphomicrobiales bacterium]
MTPVEAELRRLIAADGPQPVARLMALANAHYYATCDPFGAAGDFVTAPEISQIFGELVGLWAAAVWQAMGAPDPVLLVELGPGRGTLMADALRAAKVVPAFRRAAQVHLVETSPTLRDLQAKTLGSSGVAPAWHADLSALPEGPTIVIANEFFDALPIHQFVAAADGWRERVVGLGADGALAFGLSPPLPIPPAAAGRADGGSLVEVSFAARRVMQDLAQRLTAQGGAALVIDYGYAAGGGDTLQALRSHRFADPLADPGEADLTAHVDFGALARAAKAAGATVHGPVSQRDFLLALGIEIRAALLAKARGADPATIAAAAARLVDPAPTGMGTLFKAMAVTDPSLPPPPAFGTIAAGSEPPAP